MNEAVIREKLVDLCRMLARAPQSKGLESFSDGRYISEPPSKNQSSSESFEMLMLQLKYILFDLEATRRENRYLRQMLENRPNPDFHNDTDNNSDGGNNW